MKHILITDTHLGVRNSNVVLMQHQMEFYKNVLFPFAKEHGIKNITHLGDFFDSRSALTHKVIHNARCFVENLEVTGIDMRIIVGNHDIPSKTNNENDAPSGLLEPSEFVLVLNHFETIGNCAYAPWINKNNYDQFIDFIQKSKAKYLFGHFDFLGAKFSKYGNASHDGIDPNIVKKFDKVFSGHFHTKSTIGNIEYLGAPFQYTWADWDDQKGFHVFDDETGSLEFIKNPCDMFYKIKIKADGSKTVVPEYSGSFDGKFVIIESEITDKKVVQKAVESISGAEDVQVSIKTQESIVEDIRIGSIDTMLVDGVQSVRQDRQHGVLNILQSAMEKLK
jgi:DNA repair exonuclease SbcCD nuclease subunit